jgi:hypothetical protein
VQADEIRKIPVYGGDAGTSEIAEMLREVAAQMAELNKELREFRFIFGDVVDQGAGEKFPGYIRSVRATE